MTLSQYIDFVENVNHIEHYTLYMHFKDIWITYKSTAPIDRIEDWSNFHVAYEEIRGYLCTGYFNIEVELKE